MGWKGLDIVPEQPYRLADIGLDDAAAIDPEAMEEFAGEGVGEELADVPASPDGLPADFSSRLAESAPPARRGEAREGGDTTTSDSTSTPPPPGLGVGGTPPAAVLESSPPSLPHKWGGIASRENWGEGQPRAVAPVSTPYPNPLPMEGGEGTPPREGLPPPFSPEVEATASSKPFPEPPHFPAWLAAASGGYHPAALLGRGRDSYFRASAPSASLLSPAAWERLRLGLARVSLWLVYGGCAWFALVLLSLMVYRFVAPPASSLMILHMVTGGPVRQAWVPVERMSPHLVRAVIASEDARFCQHAGIDIEEMAEALARARNGGPRGASTISMQVAKNLYLWPAKSYVRKLVELPLAVLIEIAWPKQRIFEVYANTAEWGPGVFGAEAAARHHFGKSAANLSETEAALLAAALPNPRRRVAGNPGPGTQRLARLVRYRMRAGAATVACVTAPRRQRVSTRASARRGE